MAAETPATPGPVARGRQRHRSQHRDLLAPHRPVADRRARPRGRRVQLLRHERRRSRRSRSPSRSRTSCARCSPTRRSARRSSRSSPSCSSRAEKRDAYRLASALRRHHRRRADGRSRVFFTSRRAADHAAADAATSRPQLDDLTVGLSQVLFPIVLLLGLNGLFVGILNAYDHFTIPALAPLVWNFVIIGVLVALRRASDGADEIYAYAIGVLAGTVVQLACACRCSGVSASGSSSAGYAGASRDRRVRQVLTLMLPITLSLGIINFDLFINSLLGSTVSEAAPRAIDAAFRLYMLPQGMFSVAVATVLFPALSRLSTRRDLDGLRALMGTGVRQIALLLIPAGDLHARARRADHPPRLRARRVRDRFDGPRVRGAVLVLVQPPVRGHQPPADAHVLLAAAALAADRPSRRRRSSSTSSSRSPSSGRSGSRASSSARRSPARR